MPQIRISPIEKLRQIWTPGREIEEFIHRLDPQRELDSMVRHILHAIVQQQGPHTIDLGSEIDPVKNHGTLRWEIVHGPGPEDMPEWRRRELTIWVE
jgi:predicted P-loop ATPase